MVRISRLESYLAGRNDRSYWTRSLLHRHRGLTHPALFQCGEHDHYSVREIRWLKKRDTEARVSALPVNVSSLAS